MPTAQARDYPLVRIKYGLLLAPAAACWPAVSGWNCNISRGLKANVITSCCGSLFSGEAKTIAG